ncbi:MAG: YiaA/YiaB family inner membrane protein [Candidatus Contendobacter sp.]|nr:YiaA/YiaB family inner membrane protein [Candidatus Contendobacter sp.]
MSHNQKYLVRRDTAAWIMQVWISFGLAVLACAIGVWNIPNQELDRAFLATGFFFCLFTCFALAKMIRDNRDERVDTGAWIFTAWVGFFVAMALTAWGLFRLAIGNWEKGYMVVSWLFMVSSAFVVAKTLRDKFEADLMEAASNLDHHDTELIESK